MRNLAIVLLTMGALTCGLYAQSTAGRITGIVTDATGAVIPGAEVTIANTDTTVVNRAQTNASGVYLAVSLLAGHYQVDVQAQGFRRKEIRSLVLQTGQELRIDVQLELGAVTEAIEVQATVTQLQQESAEISDTYTSNEVMNMPVNGRSPYSLLDLSAGVSAVGDDPSNPNYGDRVSINGSRSRGNQFTVDGATTTHIGGIGERVGSIEAISEFKLYSHTYSAEFGRTAGGMVSFQIRSGSQKYRGSLYEFHRNSAFNGNSWANNANGIKAVTRQRNEFGGTLGGPIPKMNKKMFFFGSFEGTRDAQPITRTKTIPEPSIRGGNFAGIPVVVNDPLSGAPFPDNVIPSSRLDPASVKFMTLFPEPNVAGNLNSRYGIRTNNWVRATSSKDSGNYTIVRGDYNPTSHDKFFVTFSTVKEGPRDQGRDFLNQLNTTLGPRYRTMRRSTIGYTRVLSPTMTHEFLAHAQRDPRVIEPWYPEYDISRELGIARKLGSNLPTITISGMTSYGNSRRARWIHQPSGLSDSVTWLKGRHALKFGAQLYQNQFWYISTGDLSGSYTFNGEITGLGAAGRSNPVNAVADLLLGSVKTASAPVPQIPINRTNYNLGAFINDTWKTTRRLTLNLGLRYEFELRQIVKNNVYSRIDPDNGKLLVAGRNASRNLDLKNDFVNLAPRLGVAYMLDDKTVLRSGFAMFYSNFWMDNGEMVAYPGWTTSKTFTDQGVGVAQPFTLREGLPVQDVTIVPDPMQLYQAATQKSPLTVSSVSYDRSANLPRSTQWNFGIQRSLPFQTVLEVSY
ncbi:MAG: carboxypeptidase regulatory-like domain-containing protein, partial [Acidobacteria bacterium]|nr:carboxypeptidase regulatory-like domain-containing protein [Acidobacteriota bacterium]